MAVGERNRLQYGSAPPLPPPLPLRLLSYLGGKSQGEAGRACCPYLGGKCQEEAGRACCPYLGGKSLEEAGRA